jgi:hypothetical protein
MISRNEIVAAYPIVDYLAARGVEVKPAGKSHMCRCPYHEDRNPSMGVWPDKGTWKCFACNIGGSVIDLYMRDHGLSLKEALREMAKAKNLMPADYAKPKKTATYDYKDAYGRPVMTVERIEEGDKKRFVQSRIVDGKRVNGIEGVQRVLYRLDKWTSEKDVSLCEGEKCVHALESLDLAATTNPGGSNGWLDAYAMFLKNKHVDIYPDNDEPGAKWLAAVLASLEGKVKSLRVLRIPAPYGDVADLVDAQGVEMAEETLDALKQQGQIVDRGVNVALLSSREAYQHYVDRVRTIDENGVDLGKWLPSFRQNSRILLPGDMVVILSDTGVGKTAILLNIAQSQRPLCCIFFELELSTEPMCERFIARTTKTNTLDVETKTKRGEKFDVSEWDHVFMCPSSKVSIDDMREIIVKSELKTQQKPALVMVDYIGLMDGMGGKRYEKISNIAEGLKQLARETNTVIVVASQINRDKDRTEVNLHDAKESGSIENSAQLVIGAWRPSNDRICLKILKNTKKAGQAVINCIFDGNRQFIGEYEDDELA